MTLKDCTKQHITVVINDSLSTYLRYDMRALLALEEQDIVPFVVDSYIDNYSKTRAVIKAGLRCFADDNNADEQTVERLITLVMDNEHIILWLKAAVILALPTPPQNATPKKSESSNINYGQLRCIYCDIMHRSDSDFWTATIREIAERWDIYAEVKGYKTPTQRFTQFDDD